MNIQNSGIGVISLFLTALVFSLPVAAASQPFEFHADGKMVHAQRGPVDRAYGYMNVLTDSEGNGTINVMFSNGSGQDLAQFNARVKFLDTMGAIIREEYFDCWMDAEGLREAIECKVTKPLSVTNFDSIAVDFYLSEPSANNATAAIY
jgi:hypothetical protein